MTLGVLAPYRRLGIGSWCDVLSNDVASFLLHHTAETCKEGKLNGTIDELYLHVHVSALVAVVFMLDHKYGSH